MAAAGSALIRRAFRRDCLSLDLALVITTSCAHRDIDHAYTGTDGGAAAGDHGKIGHDKAVQWHHAPLYSPNDPRGRCHNGTHRPGELRARSQAAGARAFAE